jgi:hypothetical protein
MNTPEEREEYYQKQMDEILRDHPANVLPGMIIVIFIGIFILAQCQGWTYPVEGGAA